MVLAKDAPVEADMAQVVGLEGDDVIEIGLTPNRNDAMGHWGVARDLRAGLLHGTVGIGPMSTDDLVLPACSDLNAALKEATSVSLSVEAAEGTTWPWNCTTSRWVPAQTGPKSSCAPLASSP